jgi:hypothetical protein
MVNRRIVVAAACAALVAGALQLRVAAAMGTFNRTMYLTFSGPVQLPGVTLGAGRYIFEMPDPLGAADIVRVTNARHDRVYFQGFTLAVDRPWHLKDDQVITFGEAAKGAPAPIKVWYPRDARGREFLYRR